MIFSWILGTRWIFKVLLWKHLLRKCKYIRERDFTSFVNLVYKFCLNFAYFQQSSIIQLQDGTEAKIADFLTTKIYWNIFRYLFRLFWFCVTIC